MTEDRPFNHVAVIYGGFSAEREVSLASGRAVVQGLQTAGYSVEGVDLQSPDFDLSPTVEAAFIALHGEFGEDGQIQAILRDRGIPYTGPDPEASWRAFDKRLTKHILEAGGVPTPPYELLKRGEARTIPVPLVTKPPLQGSSIGLERVFDESDWPDAFEKALQYGDEVLVEQFIEGAELTVGIVGDEPLPVIEIRAPDGYYDYRAKYTKGLTEYLVPAPISEETATRCRAWAVRAYELHGCRGLSRVDFRLDTEGNLYVLEVNTIPGFTETSLLPKAAKAAGIDFPTLCDRILRMASV